MSAQPSQPIAGEGMAARIADLVADRLAAERLPQIVTAQQLADYLGVAREVVYAHADELGAIRIGSGERPRLRFPLDPQRVREWQERSAKRSSEALPAPAQRSTARHNNARGQLLPIKGHGQ